MSSPCCFQLLEVLDQYLAFDFDQANGPPLRQSLMFVGSSFNMSQILLNADGIPSRSDAKLNRSEPLSLILGALGAWTQRSCPS